MSYNQDYEPVTADELTQYDESMGEAEVQERRSAPDGSYQVEVERAILTRTKSSAEPMLKWQLDIIGPTHIGSKLFKNHLFRPSSLPFLKTDLHVMGFDVQAASEIPGLLDQLIGIRLNVRKLTNGDNENVYINSRIGDGDQGTFDAQDAGERF